MDTLWEIIAVIVLAFILGGIFYYGFKRKGPWGTFWSFLLILFLGLLLASIWITPIGPVWYGAAWVDLLLIGLVFALILGAASPTYKKRVLDDPEEPSAPEVYAIGAFFWILIIFLIFGVIAGISYISF